jgi:anti-sigma factor RsiW
MGTASEQEARLIQYLLGRLPQEEAERIEEHLFTDDGFRDELLATADDLIHTYLTGSLSRQDRERFETHFLASPRHQERVDYIRDLLSALERVSTSSVEAQRAPMAARPLAHWFLPAWTLAAALTLVVAGGLLWRIVRLTRHESQQAMATPLPTPLATPQPRASGTPPAPQRQAPGEVRVVRLPRQDGSPVSVSLARQTRVVRLEVAVDGDHPSYDAVLRGRDGTEAWRAEGLAPAALGEPLVFDVPARVLAGAQYALLIEGEALRGPAAPPPLVLEYSLHVVREH